MKKLSKDKRAVYMRKWRSQNLQKAKAYDKTNIIRAKIKVLEAYGGENYCCACCGEKHYEFLSIDHINGDGKAHRKELGLTGNKFYKWLIKNNFPKGFQVLCMNCNFAKGLYGHCPHKYVVARPASKRLTDFVDGVTNNFTAP
jgi:hypothetical protein